MKKVGMVLCGGLGKRLRPITDRVPKSLVEIRKGFTILDKQLLDLKYSGVDEVILLTGYMHEKIEERYGSSWNGLEVLYSVEEEPLGTWGAIAKALREYRPKARLVIMNGDVITDINLRNMVDNASYPVTMLVVSMRSPYGIVDINGGVIVKFVEKPVLPYYINAGIYVVREDFDILDFVGTVSKLPSDIEVDVFPKLAKAGLLGSYMEPDSDVFWKSIDTVKDLEEVRREFANRVEKPWGYEKVIASADSYVYKKILVKEGYRIPLHYHRVREETIHVIKGRVEVHSTDGVLAVLRRDSAYTVKPGTPHRLVAQENTVLHEISTPNVDDTVVLEAYETGGVIDV